MSSKEASADVDALGSLTDRVAARVSFKLYLGLTLVSTYVLMLLGAYTKAIGAGLSCPDWPKCYGVWVPFLHPELLASSNYAEGFSGLQIFVEWAHRGLAMIVGFMILAAAVAAWRLYGKDVVTWALFAAVALLPFQVVLGGLTVTENLAPLIVTSHLGFAVLILLSITVAATVVWYDR